jgi:4-hydroxy-tetrahydrodipicolinate synthase
MSERLDQALRGVIPPVVTPLRPDGDLDEASFVRQVLRCLDAGCAGVFVAGSSGEGPWLTADQRRRVVELAVGTRTVVLAGVMLPGTSMTREAAVAAEIAGADAIVVSAPYYFGADDDTIVRHIQAVAGAVQVPTILYNIPQTTHNPMSAAAVARLAADPSVIGIKDSSGDLELFATHLALRDRHSFRVLQGAESVMGQSLRMGADGLVPGLGNVAPQLFVRLMEAVADGREATARAVEGQIQELRAIFSIAPTFAAMKAACEVLGACPRTTAAPLAPATDEQVSRIAGVLHSLDLEVASAP